MWRVFGNLMPLFALAVLISAIVAGRAVSRARRIGETAGPAVATGVARVWVVTGAIAVGIITLTPVGGPDVATGVNLVPLRSLIGLSTTSVDASVAIRNIAGNVVLFVPIGIALGVAFRGRPRPLVAATLTGLLISLAIEISQYVFAVGRVVDIDDVVLNVAGTWLGAAGVLTLLAALRASDRSRVRVGAADPP